MLTRGFSAALWSKGLRTLSFMGTMNTRGEYGGGFGIGRFLSDGFVQA